MFSQLSQQLVATPIISPAKPATSTTRSSVRTQARAGSRQRGNHGVYLLRVQTAAASVNQRVTLEQPPPRTGCLLESEKTVVCLLQPQRFLQQQP